MQLGEHTPIWRPPLTKLLEEVIRKASTLPQERQNHYAAVLLEKMDQDEQWEATLHSQKSLDLLDEWAAEALADRRAGRSEPLDPETL
jgi:hypothetical protein